MNDADIKLLSRLTLDQWAQFVDLHGLNASRGNLKRLLFNFLGVGTASLLDAAIEYSKSERIDQSALRRIIAQRRADAEIDKAQMRVSVRPRDAADPPWLYAWSESEGIKSAYVIRTHPPKCVAWLVDCEPGSEAFDHPNQSTVDGREILTLAFLDVPRNLDASTETLRIRVLRAWDRYASNGYSDDFITVEDVKEHDNSKAK